MADRLAIDPLSQPPVYRGDYLMHQLVVPGVEFDPEIAARALSTRGRELIDLPAEEIDRVRAEAELDVRPWARYRRYHVDHCPGCTGHLRVGGVPED